MPRFETVKDDSYRVKDNAATKAPYFNIHLEACSYGGNDDLARFVDMLNYADKHMPKPQRTLEDFLDMSNEELNSLVADSKEGRGVVQWAENVNLYYRWLRPELKELGYYIDVVKYSHGTEFKLYESQPDKYVDYIDESEENTPARIYTILYLLAKELKHEEA